jgi:hypothetical protein
MKNIIFLKIPRFHIIIKKKIIKDAISHRRRINNLMLKDFILFVYITTLVTRPFFSGHVSAFINKTGNWHVAAPQ